MKKCVPLLFLLCIPLVLKAQKDTVTQKINKLPYVKVDSDPKFQGQTFEKYLTDHIHLRSYAKTIVYGNAILAMKIESDGSVSDIKLLKTLSPDVDKEIIRIISTSPKWQPAVANNSPVGVYVVFNIAVSAQGPAQTTTPPKKQIHITPVATRSTAPAKPKIKSVTTTPEFPGGDDAFGRYLRTSIAYPANAKKNKIEGIVMVVFIINADGSIGQTRVTASPSPDLTEEAVRVIKASPRWKPAIENGKPIESSRTIPINFQFQP